MKPFRAIRAIDSVIVQATVAASLSFSHIKEVAEAAGQTGWQAYAYPVSVDLLLVAAFRRARSVGGIAAWFWFCVGLVATLAANVVSVVDPHNASLGLRVVVAGWPALALLGGTLLVHSKRAEAARAAATVADASVAPSVEHNATDTTVSVAPALSVAPSVGEALRPAASVEPALPIVAPSVADTTDTVASALSVEPSVAPGAARVVTVAQAADALGVPAATIRGWRRGGKITDHGYEGRAALVNLLECRKLVQA